MLFRSDNVTLESHNAGKNAATYVKGKQFDGSKIEVKAVNGVRYTVPTSINPENIEDSIDVRFRVGEVYKSHYVSVYFDETREVHRKKRILTPGEMETVKLTKAMFEKYAGCSKITFMVEGE